MPFKDRQLNSITFQAWKMKVFKSMTFQVFHDLYEPCSIFEALRLKQIVYFYCKTIITLVLYID